MSPDETPAYLQIELNGQRVDNLIALRVEVPSGEKTPLLKATLEFYTALDLETTFDKIQSGGSNLELYR